MTFDLICAGIVLVFAVFGLWRGLVKQVFGLVGFLGGLLLAHQFAPDLGKELGPSLGLPPAAATIAFSIALFIVIELVARMLGDFLHARLGGVTSAMNRLGGAAVGGAKGVLVAWAVASLGSLLHQHVPQAEKAVPLLAKLELGSSQAAKLALDKGFLGDLEKQFGPAADAVRKSAGEQVKKKVVEQATK